MPKTSTYNVRTNNGLEQVQGTALKIKGLEEFTFFVCRIVKPISLLASSVNDKAGWQVCELSTGCAVVSYLNISKKIDAVPHFMRSIQSSSTIRKELHAKIQQRLKLYGVANGQRIRTVLAA